MTWRDLTDTESRQMADESWTLIEDGALLGVDYVVLRFGRGPAAYQYSSTFADEADIPALLEHAAKQIRAYRANRTH